MPLNLARRLPDSQQPEHFPLRRTLQNARADLSPSPRCGSALVSRNGSILVSAKARTRRSRAAGFRRFHIRQATARRRRFLPLHRSTPESAGEGARSWRMSSRDASFAGPTTVLCNRSPMASRKCFGGCSRQMVGVGKQAVLGGLLHIRQPLRWDAVAVSAMRNSIISVRSLQGSTALSVSSHRPE